jgi:Arc/MetJ-type ribon-helix-helix transcriptional regulator
VSAKLTVTLPDDLLHLVDRARAPHRGRSEVVRDALRLYFGQMADDEATPEEIASIEHGRAQIARGESVTLVARGESVTLEEALHGLGLDPRTGRRKAVRPAPSSGS